MNVIDGLKWIYIQIQQLRKFKTIMTKNQQHDISLKILLIGNSGVGKSCILLRFAENKFTNNFYNTIGVDFKIKYQDVNGQKVKLVLWDTAGQQRFRTITNSYYRGAQGIVIVYDITDRNSFDNVSSWYDQMMKNVNQKVACMLVGNKLDLQRKRMVKYQQGRDLAKKYNIPFYETSARQTVNVTELFEKLANSMLENVDTKRQIRNKPFKPPVPLSNVNQQQFCTCCGTK